MRGPQVAHAHVCVYLRRRHRCVSEEVLDAPQIGAVLEQMRGECVPERVRGALGNAGRVELPPNGSTDVSRAERPHANAHEEVIALRRSQVGPTLDEVPVQGVGAGPAQRHDPILPALSRHAHGGLIGMYVGKP